MTGCTTACLKAVGTQPDDNDKFIKIRIQGPIVSNASLIMREGMVSSKEFEFFWVLINSFNVVSEASSNRWKAAEHTEIGA